MTNVQLIEQKLPADLHQLAASFSIPDDFLEDMPELIELILRSKSIDTTEEKQNRFNLLPLMNTTQLEKLNAILQKEKIKLQEIEEKYEWKKQEIKKQYLQKRQDMWYVKQVAQVQEKENAEKKQDDQDAEALLSMI